MTVRELIKNKDYDYIEFRVSLPDDYPFLEEEEHSEFFGSCHSKNGVLIPDDGDSYDYDEELVNWYEWDDERYGIKNGLTVVEEGVWIRSSDLQKGVVDVPSNS